jgi:hypothetical protein
MSGVAGPNARAWLATTLDTIHRDHLGVLMMVPATSSVQ